MHPYAASAPAGRFPDRAVWSQFSGAQERRGRDPRDGTNRSASGARAVRKRADLPMATAGDPELPRLSPDRAGLQ